MPTSKRPPSGCTGQRRSSSRSCKRSTHASRAPSPLLSSLGFSRTCSSGARRRAKRAGHNARAPSHTERPRGRRTGPPSSCAPSASATTTRSTCASTASATESEMSSQSVIRRRLGWCGGPTGSVPTAAWCTHPWSTAPTTASCTKSCARSTSTCGAIRRTPRGRATATPPAGTWRRSGHTHPQPPRLANSQSLPPSSPLRTGVGRRTGSRTRTSRPATPAGPPSAAAPWIPQGNRQGRWRRPGMRSTIAGAADKDFAPLAPRRARPSLSTGGRSRSGCVKRAQRPSHRSLPRKKR
mmetsp:Transcript_54302/g.129032  ORF Transcript_54302/g.129032 Transcript_54302/m.129032 type:complete len:296 (+) Transcript_54302:784-1671(+)